MPRPHAGPLTTRRFDGQLAGERVIWIKRRSWLLLATTAWPMLVGIILVILLGMVGDTVVGAQMLQAIGVLLLLGYIIWWAAAIWWPWRFEHYILTDQRVVKMTGWYPNRQCEEIGQKSIAQVRVEYPNPLAALFQIGDVEVRPIGSPILLAGVSRPRDIADAILGMVEAHEKSAREKPPPQVANPRLQARLDQLAQPQPLPVPPPLRRRPSLAGFVQRKIPIRLIEDEVLLDLIYRHWFILLRNELPAIGLIAAGIVVGIMLGPIELGASLSLLALASGVLSGLIVGFLIYLNWADDVFILTTHRMIDIDRLFFILAEYSNDAPYTRVQNVQVEQSVLGYVLGYGSIVVETSGRKHPIKMRDIPHAFAVMDRIFEQIHLIRERESVTAINKQKKENHHWLATMLNDLLVSVPDLRGLSLLEAIATAQQAGLRLVVEAERPVLNVPASQVLDQTPLAGSSTLTNSEVRVSVSGQGVPPRPF